MSNLYYEVRNFLVNDAKYLNRWLKFSSSKPYSSVRPFEQPSQLLTLGQFRCNFYQKSFIGPKSWRLEISDRSLTVFNLKFMVF